MADVMELRCWPSCVDALDWSEDGIIALGSDERVELLFPNTVTFDRDQDVAQWQHVSLQVPWFTNEELPTKESAPITHYSIGEEISASAPIAIAWSPPGLAKHRRCALAALTANLVLSIWSADGKPHEESSWDRRLIINDSLSDYFRKNANSESSHITPSVSGRMRLRTRIRAFAWAPEMSNLNSTGIFGSCLSYGQYILAISNDDNQLVLVTVNSPTTTYGADENWKAEVVTHASLPFPSGSILSAPSCFDDMIRQQRHISHISWSPWIMRGNFCSSIIAYATNDDVRARVVKYTPHGISLGDEVVYPQIEMRHNGLMKWAPSADKGLLTLALFSIHGLFYLKLSIDDASIIERATHDLDGRWDQVSGAVWEVSHRPIYRLHFSSLFSTIQSSTAALEASSNSLAALQSPSWRDQIENSAALFSAKNELKGNSKMKVWGLASSPLGDFIATCHSIHPSDMIEYGSPSDRRGTVAISALIQYKELRRSFPSCLVSAEGVVFTLKKLVENTVEDSEHIPAFAEEIIGKLVKAYRPIESMDNDSGISSSTFMPGQLETIIINLKKAIFFDEHMVKDRFAILVYHACSIKNANELAKTLIAYRLAQKLLDLPVTLSQTPFSAEIRAHHQQIKLLIQTIIGSEDAPVGIPDIQSPQDHTESNTLAVSHDSTKHGADITVDIELAASRVDTCDFCSAVIPFTDLITAKCTNGHHFLRCGLSFLAIQAPAITKFCGTCNTPFLSEEFVAAQEVDGQEKDIQEQSTTDIHDGPTGEHGVSRQMNGDEEDQMGDDRMEIEQNGYTGSIPGQIAIESPDRLAIKKEKTQLPITLARVLFLACDVCVYCGSKYVG